MSHLLRISYQNSATLRPALRVPVRVLLPARRRCAPEFWVRSAIRPYPGFPFAGIRVIRGHPQPSDFFSPPRLCASARNPIFSHSRGSSVIRGPKTPEKPHAKTPSRQESPVAEASRLPSNDSPQQRWAGRPPSLSHPPRLSASAGGPRNGAARLNLGASRRSAPTLGELGGRCAVRALRG